MGQLFDCPTCGSSISVNADSCPQCGERQFHVYTYIDSWGRSTQDKKNAQVYVEHRKCPYCKGSRTKTEEKPYSHFFGLFSGTENVEVACPSCKGRGYGEKRTLKCKVTHLNRGTSNDMDVPAD